jgi:hypothetical protein
MLSKLERKIHFYRVDIGNDKNGFPLQFNPNPVLSIVNQLPFTDSDGRYLIDTDGDAVCGWVDGQGLQPCMRLGLIRRAGLPQIEQSGNLLDLDIAKNAGLVETIHIVFFPNNIVGMDFNFYGPRMSRLGYYLHMRGGEKFSPMFHPLLRKDVVAQLNYLSDVRLFDLKIHTSYIERIQQADHDLGAAFDAARQLGDIEVLEVILRPTKNGKYRIMDRLIGAARNLAGSGDLQSQSSKFILKGRREDTNKVEPIDLLRDKLIVRKYIVRMGERSRALNKDSAYDAIKSAYGQLKDELETATGISS